MRPALVQLFQTLQLVQRARVIVAYPSLFRVAVGYALMSFDNRPDSCLAFGDQLSQFLTRGGDFLIELLGLGAALGVSGVSALAFARQAFGLLLQFFERALQLPR